MSQGRVETDIKVTFHPKKQRSDVGKSRPKKRKKRSDAGKPRAKKRKKRSDAGKPRKKRTFLDHMKKIDKLAKGDKLY